MSLQDRRLTHAYMHSKSDLSPHACTYKVYEAHNSTLKFWEMNGKRKRSEETSKFQLSLFTGVPKFSTLTNKLCHMNQGYNKEDYNTTQSSALEVKIIR